MVERAAVDGQRAVVEDGSARTSDACRADRLVVSQPAIIDGGCRTGTAVADSAAAGRRVAQDLTRVDCQPGQDIAGIDNAAPILVADNEGVAQGCSRGCIVDAALIVFHTATGKGHASDILIANAIITAVIGDGKIGQQEQSSIVVKPAAAVVVNQRLVEGQRAFHHGAAAAVRTVFDDLALAHIQPSQSFYQNAAAIGPAARIAMLNGCTIDGDIGIGKDMKDPIGLIAIDDEGTALAGQGRRDRQVAGDIQIAALTRIFAAASLCEGKDCRATE